MRNWVQSLHPCRTKRKWEHVGNPITWEAETDAVVLLSHLAWSANSRPVRHPISNSRVNVSWSGCLAYMCIFTCTHFTCTHLQHTSIHLQVFGSTFKICSAPSYFPPPPRLLYSHHLHLNVTTVQSWESLCGSQQPRITLCHPSNHSTPHVTHGTKVRAFPENPGASLRPSLWPSPHTFWAALLLCMSSNMVRFALSLACTKKRCFLTRSIGCLTLTPAFAQIPATLWAFFDILFNLSTPFLPSLIYFFFNIVHILFMYSVF